MIAGLTSEVSVKKPWNTRINRGCGNKKRPPEGKPFYAA
jgi:hypothetical protein